jgi:hypothetical protein
MQQPRPHVVRVTTVDGAVHEVLCSASPWTKVGETIAALRPEMLEALDAQNRMLRATRPNDPSSDWGNPEPRPERPPAPAPSTPYIPITALDPETQRFALVAQLLADAYKHSTDVAFNRLVELVDAQNQRSESVERARETLYRTHVRQLEEALKAAGQTPPDGDGDLLTGMVANFVGGMGGSQPAPAAAGTTNGKGH